MRGRGRVRGIVVHLYKFSIKRVSRMHAHECNTLIATLIRTITMSITPNHDPNAESGP